MTRDEHRAACIEAMEMAWWRHYGVMKPRTLALSAMTAAFDALHGIAHVVPIEAAEEMIRAAYLWGSDNDFAEEREAWRTMSAAGDLTNPLEKGTS